CFRSERSSASWMSRCTYGLAVATAVAPPALAAFALDFAILTSLGSLAFCSGPYPDLRRCPAPTSRRFERGVQHLADVTDEDELDLAAQVLRDILGVGLV